MLVPLVDIVVGFEMDEKKDWLLVNLFFTVLVKVVWFEACFFSLPPTSCIVRQIKTFCGGLI